MWCSGAPYRCVILKKYIIIQPYIFFLWQLQIISKIYRNRSDTTKVGGRHCLRNPLKCINGQTRKNFKMLETGWLETLLPAENTNLNKIIQAVKLPFLKNNLFHTFCPRLKRKCCHIGSKNLLLTSLSQVMIFFFAGKPQTTIDHPTKRKKSVVI